MKPYDPLKRLIDIVLGGVALVASAPLQAVVALLVRRKLGSPVFFRQPRPGKDGVVFEMAKFRTMLELDEGKGLVTDEQRLTPFGALLRSTSLDELPTLWHVVKGHMSLVGPRPLLSRYTAYMTHRERTRMDVRPGITGWAQVHGRNNAPWDQRLEMDAWYVENRGLVLDLKCLAMTAVRVVARKNVNVVPDQSMDDLDVERGSRDSSVPGN